MRYPALATLLVLLVPAVAPGQTPLTCGQRLEGVIGFVGEQDLFTFAAQQGEIVSITVLTTAIVDTGFVASGTVYRPGGAFLQNVGVGTVGPLPQSGVYTLSIHDLVGLDQRGSYSVTVAWIHPQGRQCNQRPIGCGPPSTGSIDFGEQDFYVFEAQQGDVISFVTTTTARVDPGFFASGTVYRPNGTFLQNVGTGNIGPLAQSGTYTLTIQDLVGRNERGSYSTTLTWLQGQCPSIGAAPGPPVNLSVTISGATVMLTWTPPQTGGAVSSYVLEAGSSPGASNVIAFDTGNTATTFTATGVPPAVFFVRVRAKNAAGTSTPSNEVIVLVSGGCTAAPGAVSGLQASAMGQNVALRWSAPPGPITSYVIEAGSSSGATNIAVFDTGTANLSLSAVASPGTYFVRVRARNACGLGAPSNEVILTVN
jgi:hypothetical protein